MFCQKTSFINCRREEESACARADARSSARIEAETLRENRSGFSEKFTRDEREGKTKENKNKTEWLQKIHEETQL